jgi:hypothetical protein
MNMMKSLITSALALAALSAVGTAQSQVNSLSVQGTPGHATINMATGELTRDTQDKAATLVQVWTNTDYSGFYSTWSPLVPVEWLDWGVISSTSGSDIVGSYQFGYATTVLDTTVFGPGASLCNNFYGGATGWCAMSGIGSTPDEQICWSGLPGSTSGGAAGWIITVTLTGGFEFQLPAGAFGYSLTMFDISTGPLLCYAGSVSGGLDANGQEDAFDVFQPDVATGTCGTYWFGGGAANFSSWWLYIAKADGTTTFASNAPYCGSGVNAAAGAFTITGDAVLGGTFGVSITHTHVLGLLYAFGSPLTFPYKGMEILVNFTDPNGELLGVPSAFGNPALFALPVPINLAFCGFTFYVQGVSAGGGISLHCASACTIGF